MSAKRSWDISPSKRETRPAARPTRPAPRASGVPLRARRRKARNRILTIAVVLIVLVCTLLIYGLHRPEVRIGRVEAKGIHAEEISAVALGALSGSSYLVFPNDSIFMYPEEAVRDAVLRAFPDISSVAIGRSGFSAIEVTALPRVLAFTWCGASAAVAGTCYEADGEGFIFALTSATSSTLNIYGPLSRPEAESIGNTVAAASHVPLALQFVRSIEALGANVVSIEIRGDEADLYVGGSNTRVTYVLGQEVEAAGLAASALPGMSLTDGSIEYLDLRFPGKAYVKRRGEVSSETP